MANPGLAIRRGRIRGRFPRHQLVLAARGLERRGPPHEARADSADLREAGPETLVPRLKVSVTAPASTSHYECGRTNRLYFPASKPRCRPARLAHRHGTFRNPGQRGLPRPAEELSHLVRGPGDPDPRTSPLKKSSTTWISTVRSLCWGCSRGRPAVPRRKRAAAHAEHDLAVPPASSTVLVHEIGHHFGCPTTTGGDRGGRPERRCDSRGLICAGPGVAVGRVEIRPNPPPWRLEAPQPSWIVNRE
jgi:hypothetical protein